MDATAATAGAAGHFRDYWPDEVAGGQRQRTRRQADDTTLRPSGSGPTRQSDAQDSEPDYLLWLTSHGPGIYYLIIVKVFLCDNKRIDVSGCKDSNQPALLS